MSNRFKTNKKQTISDEEMQQYLNTTGNAGTKHDHPEWDRKPRSVVERGDSYENDFEADYDSDKERTIAREVSREEKISARRAEF